MWKDIPEFDKYEISSDRLVVRRKDNERIIVPLIKQGYPMIRMMRADGKRIGRGLHRLLAQAFIPNPFNKTIVCHRDDDKSNNALTNLYWGCHKTNQQDATRNGKWNKEMTIHVYPDRQD